jgi:hypothetical protein
MDSSNSGRWTSVWTGLVGPGGSYPPSSSPNIPAPGEFGFGWPSGGGVGGVDISSIDKLWIGVTASNNANYTNWLSGAKTLFDEGKTVRMELYVVGDTSRMGIWTVSGITAASGSEYYQIDVTNVVGSGQLTTGVPSTISWVADGLGLTGPAGPTGPGFTTISPTGGNDNYVLTAVGNDSSANAEANLTFDGNTLTVGGTVGSTGTVLNVIGASAGNILTVTDNASGTLFSVNNISGIPIFSVNSNGAYYPGSVELNYVSGAVSLITIDASSGRAAWFDYSAKDVSNNGARAGTVTAIWDTSGAVVVTYTDTSTADINGSTEDLIFDVVNNGVNNTITLQATATVKTYNIKVGTRVI